MGKVAIVTDSNSGITQSEAKELGVYVIPMPFYINEELFFEDITLTQEALSLIHISIMDASHWFTEAVLIMAALPLGLIFARILTDKEFRYSI